MCYVCLKRGHREKDCRNTTKCRNYQEKYHVSICSKEKESDIIGPGCQVKDGGNFVMQTAQAVSSEKQRLTLSGFGEEKLKKNCYNIRKLQ